MERPINYHLLWSTHIISIVNNGSTITVNKGDVKNFVTMQNKDWQSVVTGKQIWGCLCMQSMLQWRPANISSTELIHSAVMTMFLTIMVLRNFV